MSLPNYATNLAVIDKNDNNKVINIAWGYAYDTSWLKNNEMIIPSDQLAINIGDIYNEETKKFYHDGEEVLSLLDLYHQQGECLSILYQGEFEN